MDNFEQHFGVPEGFKEIESPTMKHPTPSPENPGYAPNPFLRSPLGGVSTPDALRQFYRPGVYYRRFFPAKQGG